MSRNLVPSKLLENKYWYSHHGPVCIKMNILKKYRLMKNTKFQMVEDNEWLKIIEHGYKLRSIEVKNISQEINIRSDLNFYRKKLK